VLYRMWQSVNPFSRDELKKINPEL